MRLRPEDTGGIYNILGQANLIQSRGYFGSGIGGSSSSAAAAAGGGRRRRKEYRGGFTPGYAPDSERLFYQYEDEYVKPEKPLKVSASASAAGGTKKQCSIKVKERVKLSDSTMGSVWLERECNMDKTPLVLKRTGQRIGAPSLTQGKQNEKILKVLRENLSAEMLNNKCWWVSFPVTIRCLSI